MNDYEEYWDVLLMAIVWLVVVLMAGMLMGWYLCKG